MSTTINIDPIGVQEVSDLVDEHLGRTKATSIGSYQSTLTCKSILYISSYDTSEQNLLASLLIEAFGVEVSVYPWELSEIEEPPPAGSPYCIIISPPLRFERYSQEYILKVIQGIYPSIPVIWLTPSKVDTPKFLLSDTSVHVLYPQVSRVLIRTFLKLVEQVSGLTNLSQF